MPSVSASKPKTSSSGAKKPVSTTTTTATTKPKTKPKGSAVADGLDKSKARTRAKSVVDAVPTAPTLDALDVASVFPIAQIGSIDTPSGAGQVFRLDSGFVDAMRMQVRRVESKTGTPGFSISFKVSGPARDAFAKRLEKLGAKKVTYTFAAAKEKKSKGQFVLARSAKTHALSSSFYSSNSAPKTGNQADQALRLEGKGFVLEFIPNDGPYSLRGEVRIELEGTDAVCSKSLETLTAKAGLQNAFAPPTPTTLERYALMKLLWRVSPSAAKTLVGKKTDLASIKIADIKAALKKQGVSAARMKALRYEEVAPGHFTVIDDATAKEAINAGAKFCYSTVTNPQHVLSIVEQGQKATITRWNEGALIEGMSSMADVGTGGALGVFSRIVVPEADKKSWTGRTYKIVLRPEIFGRLDIWGWDGDKYGRGWDLKPENFGAGLVKSVRNKEGQTKVSGSASYYTPSGTTNEIVSPIGNGPRWIAAVVATSESDRKKLITVLKKAKFKPPGGGKIESFVRLEPKIRADMLD